MASTTHKPTPPQHALQKTIDNKPSRDRPGSNDSLTRLQTKPTVALSKPAEGRAVPAPTPLITERKTIVRHMSGAQESINAPLFSVGPIPACGLDDWKYKLEQSKQKSMETNADSSLSGSLHFLRLPLGQLNQSGFGASCASLLVHAPSLSRVSGQTDEDFPGPDEDSISSAFWSHKPLGYIDPGQSGCPICYRGDYATGRANSIAFYNRSRSLCNLCLPNGTDQSELAKSILGTGRPLICLFHKASGWDLDGSGAAYARPPAPNKSSLFSISLPSLHLAVFSLNSKNNEAMTSLPTPKVKLSSNTHREKSPSTVNTSQHKCESWLQSWR